MPRRPQTKWRTWSPNPLKKQLPSYPGVQRITSRSRAGVSEVTMEFGWDTNMDFAAMDVREKIDLVQLPRDTEKPNVLRFDPSNDPILRVILSGGLNLVELRKFADKTIKKDLESLDGIAAVKINGGLEEEIHVYLDETKLAALGLTVQDVNNTLSRNNINIAGGSLYENEARYLVRTLNEFQESPRSAFELIVKEDNHRKILLQDVATIERGTKDREVITRINGKEGVELAIFKEGDANTVQVASAAKAAAGIDSEEHLWVHPPKPISTWTSCSISRSSSRTRSTKFVIMQLSVVLLAMFILFFFLKEFRSTVIIGLSIPISIIATFFVMYQLNIKLNIMSLGGLALGVGMLVDDAIVVLESIVRHYKDGSRWPEPPMKAQKKSASPLPQVRLQRLLYSFRFPSSKELPVRCSKIWQSRLPFRFWYR